MFLQISHHANVTMYWQFLKCLEGYLVTFYNTKVCVWQMQINAFASKSWFFFGCKINWVIKASAVLVIFNCYCASFGPDKLIGLIEMAKLLAWQVPRRWFCELLLCVDLLIRKG